MVEAVVAPRWIYMWELLPIVEPVVKVQVNSVQVVLTVWLVRQLVSEPLSLRPMLMLLTVLVLRLSQTLSEYWVLGLNGKRYWIPPPDEAPVVNCRLATPKLAWVLLGTDVSVPLPLPDQLLVLPFSNDGLGIRLVPVVAVETFTRLVPPAFWIWKAAVELEVLANTVGLATLIVPVLCRLRTLVLAL